jgi:hypothetical protein
MSFARAFREVWLSIFVLFFRISRWKGSMKATSATAGPAMLEAVLAVSGLCWLEIVLHHRFYINKWLIGVLGAIIFWVNSHVLVGRGSGLKFEKEFSEFSSPKQAALFSGAALTTVAIGFFLYFTVTVYHRAFGIGQ